jgi:oxygen-independent coproporphyrinogen-3 oxidase
MKLYLQGHDFRYAVEQMMMTLFPGQKPEYPETLPDGDSPAARVTLSQTEDTLTAHATLWWEGSVFDAERTASTAELIGGLDDDRVRQRIIRFAFYDAGAAALGYEPPWGALTGVRPVKLPTRWMADGMTPEQAREEFINEYRVTPSRADLAMDCAVASLSVKQSLADDELSLYVGIPFCPTRCIYCSFISADVKGALAMVEPYVEALCREIREAGEQLKARGLFIRTAYMGGGTPTTLSAEQMDRVLSAMESHLPMERCHEFTVEAGRPDTITAEKLAVLKAHGIHRISINPQTMEDEVLRIMGRSHTAAQITEAMAMAKEHYGGMVNMDLIAGLPGDSVEGFRRTLDKVLTMDPENITIHTLALKKGARLMEQRGQLCSDEDVSNMLSAAEAALLGAGYRPYYLYRQKYMSGSFENVGWCKPGTRCDYNIIMMEELQSVLSLGAGGITKLVDPSTGKIERLNNPKYPKEYLDHWEKISTDKAKFAEFQADLAAR